ncbi:MAG: hypothetical protein IJN78_08925 [Clostridia bacterium]|nr:hypothetical protein [Clostridia bacterium]MBQ3129146.1 hypothetical protein [Clostridia bacterium]MBQ7044702.1 hypothetical protein [Clostridia bacterium]
MKNTIISCIVAILCVVALCVTYASCTPDTKADTAVADYLTEAEAADYIGVTDEVMVMMREKLGLFKGAYMAYMYLDANGKEVTDIVYKKDALNEAVDKIMDEHGAYNFKFLQEAASK